MAALPSASNACRESASLPILLDSVITLPAAEIMPLTDFISTLDTLQADATQAFNSAQDADALEAARIEFLGAKSGRLKEAQKGLGTVDKADKPAAGKRFNEVKPAVEAAFAAAQARVSASAGEAKPVGRVRPDAAGQAVPPRPSASAHADDRRAEGHHGPARLHAWPTGRRSKTSGTTSRP